MNTAPDDVEKKIRVLADEARSLRIRQREGPALGPAERAAMAARVSEILREIGLLQDTRGRR